MTRTFVIAGAAADSRRAQVPAGAARLRVWVIRASKPCPVTVAVRDVRPGTSGLRVGRRGERARSRADPPTAAAAASLFLISAGGTRRRGGVAAPVPLRSSWGRVPSMLGASPRFRLTVTRPSESPANHRP